MTMPSRPARPYTEAMRARTRELIFAVQIASPYSRARRAYARNAWDALDEAGQRAALVMRADAIGEVIEINDGLIIAGAIRWRGVVSDNVSEEDVEAACQEGLLRALTRFDLDRDVQFSTYATTAMNNTVYRMVDSMRPFGADVDMMQAQARVRAAKSAHVAAYGESPSLAEIVEATGLPRDMVRAVLSMPVVVSGDGFDGDDDAPAMEGVAAPEDTELQSEVNAAVARAEDRFGPLWRDFVGTPLGDELVRVIVGADHEVYYA